MAESIGYFPGDSQCVIDGELLLAVQTALAERPTFLAAIPVPSVAGFADEEPPAWPPPPARRARQTLRLSLRASASSLFSNACLVSAMVFLRPQHSVNILKVQRQMRLELLARVKARLTHIRQAG